MKASDLRKSILQAAAQGKLVPQDKSDEPASELLKRIQTDKATLIKDGKLKKEKPMPPITEDEIPYDLPEGWVWCRLSDIGEIVGGATPDSHNPDYYTSPNNGIPWITPADMKYAINNYISCGKKDITLVGYNSCSTRMLPTGSIIFSSRAPIGHIAFAKNELCTNQGFKSVAPFEQKIAHWIFISLQSKVEDIESRASGTTFKEVSGKFMEQEIIPLPPLAEQQRIVAKVDELMALCDELEAAEKELDTLEAHFTEYLPKSILQSAVQGKLVPQDKNDEPASELLKRIQAEKSKLTKEGKLKKEKPLPPITENEIPYDLPDGWVWCRLGNLGITNIGLTYKPSDVSSSGTPVLRSGNIQNGRIDLSDLLYVSCSVPQKLYTENGDILICARNGSKRLVGKSAIIQTDGMSFGAFMAIFRSAINPYVHKFLNSPIFMGQMHDNSSDTTTINQITQNMLKLALCPVPPLAEQHRIVAKVDDLMALCDELKQVGVQPIDHSNVVTLPVEADAQEEPLLMAAQGKISEMPSQKHTAALDDLIGMMDNE